MTILGLIVLIICVGMVLGAINKLLPMAPMIKALLNFFITILIVVYILQFFKILQITVPIPYFFNF